MKIKDVKVTGHTLVAQLIRFIKDDEVYTITECIALVEEKGYNVGSREKFRYHILKDDTLGEYKIGQLVYYGTEKAIKKLKEYLGVE